MTLASEFEQVKEFHETFSPATNKTPTAFTVEEALYRADFTTEEILEFLYATVEGDLVAFDQLVAKWQEGITKTVKKSKQKPNPLKIN